MQQPSEIRAGRFELFGFAGNSAPDHVDHLHAMPELLKRLEAKEGYVEAGDGVRLFYRSVGTGGDTVVVLHGGPGFSMDYLAADLEPLAARHVLLFYDQRGTGRSTLVTDSVSLDAQRFADDLEAVRRQFGIQRLTLLGHSWERRGGAHGATPGAWDDGHRRNLGQADTTREAFRQNARRDSAIQRRLRELGAARVANPGDAASAARITPVLSPPLRTPPHCAGAV
jgi:hypothetical protein